MDWQVRSEFRGSQRPFGKLKPETSPEAIAPAHSLAGHDLPCRVEGPCELRRLARHGDLGLQPDLDEVEWMPGSHEAHACGLTRRGDRNTRW